MAAAVGDRGVVGRYGGDEFLVVLGEALPDEVQRVLRDLNNSLESLTFSVPSLRAYANFGVACFKEDGESSDEVLAVADRRMYENKGKRIGGHCPRHRERSP
jgi:diguanylate cyclase (GGDEF)-like protein